jgi:hypothetical protein
MLRAYTYALNVTRLYLRAWSYAPIVTRLELRAYSYAPGVTRLHWRAWSYAHIFLFFSVIFLSYFYICEKLFGRFYGPVWDLQYSQCFGEIVGPSWYLTCSHLALWAPWMYVRVSLPLGLCFKEWWILLMMMMMITITYLLYFADLFTILHLLLWVQRYLIFYTSLDTTHIRVSSPFLGIPGKIYLHIFYL